MRMDKGEGTCFRLASAYREDASRYRSSGGTGDTINDPAALRDVFRQMLDLATTPLTGIGMFEGCAGFLTTQVATSD